MKRLRLLALLVLLGLVLHHQWIENRRHIRWDAPLFVAIYPIAADSSERSARSVAALDLDDFQPIVDHLRQQAAAYGIEIERPLYLQLGRAVQTEPPAPPIGAGFFARAAWVAKARWWRLRFDEQGLDPDIVVLARYHDPDLHPVLPHSTGLQPIRLVLANLYAGRGWHRPNQVVLLHELLHTLGATDKYDLTTGRPIHPHGYAEPDRVPRYPQTKAELMAGRIAVSAVDAVQADRLERTVIGARTASEIGWLDRAE